MLDFMQEVLKIWLYFGMFNATFTTLWQIKNPVCDKAHRESLIINTLSGPIFVVGGIILILYVLSKRLTS